MEFTIFGSQKNWVWGCFSTMNGRNSSFWILKFQCDQDLAYKISYNNSKREFAVCVGCASGRQYHLKKYEKKQKIWNPNISSFSMI